MPSGWPALYSLLYCTLLARRSRALARFRDLMGGGLGLELGGPSTIFRDGQHLPVYSLANRIDNLNFSASTVWQGDIKEGLNFHFSATRTPGRQLIGEASDLCDIPSLHYDFVLASHVIEHLANPIQALSEWLRVTRDGGCIVLIVPHKDGTFDHLRPVTALSHLIRDFKQMTTEADLSHLPEIVELHDLARDPEAGTRDEFIARSQRNIENRCLHQHVFDTRLVVELLDHVNLSIQSVQCFRPCHIIAVARKPRAEEVCDNTRVRAALQSTLRRSPFPSDRN